MILVIFTLLIVCYTIFSCAIDRAQRKIYLEAVDKGYGYWKTNPDGSFQFKWNEPKKIVQELKNHKDSRSYLERLDEGKKN